MRRIKILRVITRLNIGGPAIHSVLLTKSLNNEEFESRLICGSVSKAEGDMGYFAGLHGVKPVYVRSLGREINLFRDIAAFFRIFAYIRNYKPDIVHTHTAKAGALGRMAAILANVPVKIHTFHGNIFSGYFKALNTRFFILVEKILAAFTNAIIAVSPAQKDEIVEKYGITDSTKCRVVRLGFELDKFLNGENAKISSLRERFNFEKDDILVGIIGRLAAIKNHRMFIDSADYIEKHPDKNIVNKIKFVIVGDGELKNELVDYCRKKGLEDKVFFAGWMKNMEDVYQGLDIVTLTSMNEGTPVSLIEAMASAKPVVATDVGGVKDALETAGILVKSGDSKRLGDAIMELASSPEKRANAGALGRDFVRNTYSKERLVTELKELYKNLLKGRQE